MDIRIVSKEIPKIVCEDVIVAEEPDVNAESIKTLITDECTRLFSAQDEFVYRLFKLSEAVRRFVETGSGCLVFESVLQVITQQIDFKLADTHHILAGNIDDLPLALDDLWSSFFTPLTCMLQKMIYLDIWLSKQPRKQPLLESVFKLFKERKKSHVELYNKIEEIVLTQINNSRIDGNFDCGMIIHLIKFVEFSGVYDNFMQKIHESSVQYYSDQSNNKIKELDFDRYINFVHTTFCNQEKFLRTFFKHSVDSVLDGILNELIATKHEYLITLGNITKILTSKNFKLLYLVKTMFSKVKCEDFYIRILVQSLVKMGLELILSESSGNDYTLINRLMRFNQFIVDLKSHGFNSEYQFNDKLKKIWKSILINTNALKITLCSLSLFLDYVLMFTHAILSDEFEFSIKLLKYINCRDDFEKLLRHIIGNRLIYTHSLNDNYHKLVDKLTSEFGLCFTYQIRMLIGDLQQSKELHQEFVKNVNYNESCNFSTLVISYLVWFKNKACDSLQLSFDQSIDNFKNNVNVAGYEQSFTSFYQEKFKNRKLIYLPEYYIIHLTCNFNKREITFQLSLIQATLLLMFNSRDMVLLDDLMAELVEKWSFNLTSDLKSLVENQVESLVSMVPPLIFSTEGQFVLNLGFYSEYNTVEVYKPDTIKVNYQLRLSDESRVLDRDTAYKIDSLLIKYIKNNNGCQIDEIFRYIRENMDMDIDGDVVKKQLDGLIERDFVKLDSQVYFYIP